MNRIINTFIIFVLILFFSGCTSEYISDGRKICFTEEVYPIIISSCTQSGCHNSADRAAEIDFSNYNEILARVHPGSYRNSELYDVITSPFELMPPKPYSRLSKENITTISLWIEQGAEITGACTVEICDTSLVTFGANVEPILNLYCNGCHKGAYPQGGINYNSFAGIKATVSDGRLIGSIKRQSGFVFMPKNGNKLPACKIAIIQKWIDEGAKNN